MEDHPARPRIAEVLVTQNGERRRGSGYLVAPGWVLTAAHVVADASEVAVWLDAPPVLERNAGVGVDLRRILLAADADLALLPVGRSHAERVELVLLGQLDRTRNDVVPVAAAGCPRFKLRPAPGRPGVELRELHVATGTIAAGSDAKTGTLELAVSTPPAEDPQTEEHSPWEGMSGAAVWASGRLVGVVGQHHSREGPGVLTVRPLTGLFAAVTAEKLGAWQQALPQLGARAEDLSPATLPSARELVEWWAQEEAAELLPPVLVARDEELADLAAFMGSPQRWRWVQGAAFAGKTALLVWFALHPPEGADVAACFLRRTASRADAGYALSMLISQFTSLADRSDDRPTSALYERVRDFRMLLKDAAQTCQQRGRRLLVLVDGLDEDQTIERGFAVARWLPDAKTLPENAWLLVASRAGVPVPLPDGHPLTSHIHELTVSVAASEIQKLAEAELEDAREAGGLVYDMLGLLAAAAEGLTVGDLTELLRRHGQRTASPVEIKDTLDGSLARSVSEVKDAESREKPVRVFAHDTLLNRARTLYVDQLPEFYALLDRWAQDYQQQAWPATTPRYLLRPYTRQLASRTIDSARTGKRFQEVIQTLYQIVTHPARRILLLERTGNPAIYDQEVTTTQRLLVDTREAIDDESELIYRLAILALSRRPLTGVLASVAASVSSVWAQAGRFRSALAITAGMEESNERAWAIASVAGWLARAGQVGEAIKVARGIGSLQEGVRALVTVAGTLAQDGWAEEAAGLADEALQIAVGIKDPWARAGALAHVAGGLAQAARAEEAISLARGIGDSQQQARALADVAGGLARAGQLGKAIRVARRIHLHRERERALADVAGELAQAGLAEEAAGLADEALQIATDIKDPWARARTLVDVAGELAQAGHAEEAMKAARGIGNLLERARALSGVAGWLARAGQAGEAAGLTDEALQIATDIENPWDRARALAAVAGGLARAGQLGKAIRVARRIHPQPARAWALTDVAGELARASHAEVAITVARGIGDSQQQVQALAAVALGLAQAGRAEEAISLAGGIGDSQEQVRALADVAGKLARAGRAEAINLAHGIGDSQQRVLALADVAVGLAQAGRVQEAAGLADEALQIATGIKDPWAREQVLADMAARLAQAGRNEEAISLARSIGDSQQRARALADVAVGLARAGQLGKAIRVARRIHLHWERERALADVAGGLAQAGRAEEAISLARRIENPWGGRALAAVAGGLAQAGRAEEAISLARGIGDSQHRARALADVAVGLTRAGRNEEAAGHADEALQIVTGLDFWERKGALAEVAARLAQAGQAKKAMSLARDTPFSSERAQALAAVAGGLAQAGQLREAIEVARNIEDHQERVRALATVAWSARGDDEDGAIYNAIHDVLLSPYAHAHLAAIPLTVVERLLAEGRLM